MYVPCDDVMYIHICINIAHSLDSMELNKVRMRPRGGGDTDYALSRIGVEGVIVPPCHQTVTSRFLTKYWGRGMGRGGGAKTTLSARRTTLALAP